ncbi:hypothetical protein [Streptomyces sp. YPW6]
MQYVQDALFPDTDVVGTGRPFPWNPDEDTTEDIPFQVEVLFGEEPQP